MKKDLFINVRNFSAERNRGPEVESSDAPKQNRSPIRPPKKNMKSFGGASFVELLRVTSFCSDTLYETKKSSMIPTHKDQWQESNLDPLGHEVTTRLSFQISLFKKIKA